MTGRVGLRKPQQNLNQFPSRNRCALSTTVGGHARRPDCRRIYRRHQSVASRERERERERARAPEKDYEVGRITRYVLAERRPGAASNCAPHFQLHSPSPARRITIFNLDPRVGLDDSYALRPPSRRSSCRAAALPPLGEFPLLDCAPERASSGSLAATSPQLSPTAAVVVQPQAADTAPWPSAAAAAAGRQRRAASTAGFAAWR